MTSGTSAIASTSGPRSRRRWRRRSPPRSSAARRAISGSSMDPGAAGLRTLREVPDTVKDRVGDDNMIWRVPRPRCEALPAARQLRLWSRRCTGQAAVRSTIREISASARSGASPSGHSTTGLDGARVTRKPGDHGSDLALAFGLRRAPRPIGDRSAAPLLAERADDMSRGIGGRAAARLAIDDRVASRRTGATRWRVDHVVDRHRYELVRPREVLDDQARKAAPSPPCTIRASQASVSDEAVPATEPRASATRLRGRRRQASPPGRG